MQLLRRIANSANASYLLIGTQEIVEARMYEARGWITLHESPSKEGFVFRERDTYAQITDSGRRALED